MAKVFLNDRIVEVVDAHIACNDSGLLYGMGLFETMRCRKRRVFRLDDHLDRLFAGVEALAINNVYDRACITDAIDKLLQANDLEQARLRLTLTNGPIGEGASPKPTLLITATEFTPYPAEYYEKGVRVVLTEARQNPSDPLSGHKSTCYASRLMVLEDARKKLATEALWFTTDNRLAEGCISNVFLVKDGIVYTPALSAGVLPGIARKTVIELAGKDSIELAEKDLAINDLLGADEIFLTNTIMLILPVVAIEAHTVAKGTCGQTTKRLMTLFQQRLSTP